MDILKRNKSYEEPSTATFFFVTTTAFHGTEEECMTFVFDEIQRQFKEYTGIDAEVTIDKPDSIEKIDGDVYFETKLTFSAYKDDFFDVATEYHDYIQDMTYVDWTREVEFCIN